MAKTTRRKMKIVGKQTYINQETGEMNEVQVIDIEEWEMTTETSLDSFQKLD